MILIYQEYERWMKEAEEAKSIGVSDMILHTTCDSSACVCFVSLVKQRPEAGREGRGK